jgi:hypothetical protein
MRSAVFTTAHDERKKELEDSSKESIPELKSELEQCISKIKTVQFFKNNILSKK